MASIFEQPKPIHIQGAPEPTFTPETFPFYDPSAASLPLHSSNRPAGPTMEPVFGMLSEAGVTILQNLTSFAERRKIDTTFQQTVYRGRMSEERKKDEHKPLSDNDPNTGTCTGPPRKIRRYTRSEWMTRADSISDSTAVL